MTDIRDLQINSTEDNEDNLSDYNPSPRMSRRPVTMSRRRNSRLLYLEKYGLNQPGWHSSDNLNDCSNESSEGEEEKPQDSIENQRKKIEEYKAQTNVKAQPNLFLPNQQPINDIPLKRPVSIRNYVQNTSAQKRPSRFVKPINSASSIGKVVLPPTEFIHVHKLLETYEKKVYIEGYLKKKNDLKSNGVSCNTKKWSIWYVELCGPVLSLWDSTLSSQEVYPDYINITDSTVTIEQSGAFNMFSLNTAGANRYILQAPDSDILRRWVLALRLSCFECSRIQEIYTSAFLSRSTFSNCLNVPKKSCSTEAGFLYVRFPNATEWKQYWVSVSNEKRKKSLFGKKMVATHGHILFYESKKAKYPVMTLQKVIQAYTVYPESPKLINMATIFKIEGSLYKNGLGGDLQLVHSCSGVLLMSTTTNEVSNWLVNVFDVFELYGRPNVLINDPLNPISLNFGQVTDSATKLFLEPAEVDNIDMKNSLLSNKSEFSTILAQKLKTSFLDTTTNCSRPKKSIPNPKLSRVLAYVSDISDEEDKMSENEADSEDESLFKIETKASIPTSKKSNEIPVSNTASKSSSEISEISSTNTIAGTTNIFLHPVNKPTIEDDFASSILNSPQFGQTAKPLIQQQPRKKKSSKKSLKSNSKDSESSSHKNTNIQQRTSLAEKGQTKQNNISRPPITSVVPPSWSNSYSANSMVNLEFGNNWDSSSVDTRTMTGATSPLLSSTDTFRKQKNTSMQYSSNAVYNNLSESVSDNNNDDDKPIANQYNLSQNQTRQKNRKSELSHVKQNHHPGYYNTAENRSADDPNALWHRMMMEQRQQQMMMQQYMQAYNTMPMMMPIVDPRLYQHPYMMMDPRIIPHSQLMMPQNMMLSPSCTGSYSNGSNRSYHSSQIYSKGVDFHQRFEKKNTSSTGSVTDSAYTSEYRPRRAKD